MKIKFDSNQDYQLEAIRSVVDIFDGQPFARGAFEVDLGMESGKLLSELGFGNRLLIDEQTILQNVRTVQERNGLPVTDVLEGMHFTTEMETGTGKTYVYLRTIYELNKLYGLRKFIIVVPSVAIREGVLKSIELTRVHFRAIYGNVPVDFFVYDSARLSNLRGFAGSNQLQIMVMNIDAFNKDTNVIRRHEDRMSGRKPLEFIQATNPVVVIDEPQNMESEQARKAIASLNPLCTLRYSATHRNLYNLVYRLDPVRAYDLRLVKRIEVDAVLDDPVFDQPYIHLKSVTATRTKITARLEIDVNTPSGPKRKTISVSSNGIDLFDRSGERDAYRGYIVNEINAGDGFVSFSNGHRIYQGETHGDRHDDVMRVQIRETVREHFEKELKLSRLPGHERMKVLSLFFIDRVANYVEPDGKIREWFVEAYNELAAQPMYASLSPLPVDQVHGGYFATTRKGEAKDTRGNTKADDEAYELIMRDKERLLSVDEPLRFIFSHSALREGWDNPNVFQICTLNESRSELRKRQEIGRGLRLPVMMNGERCFDENINRLTVVANESYEDFARKLQVEIEEETGVSFQGRIADKRKRRTARLKKGWKLNEDFRELWERIRHKTRYAVEFETEVLIAEAAERVRDMPVVHAPRITAYKSELDITERGVETRLVSQREAPGVYIPPTLPDILGYIQRETELTRATIAAILLDSGRLDDALKNPQQFMDLALRAIKNTLHRFMIDGITYEKIDGKTFEMQLFEDHEMSGYIDRMISVNRSIYDAIEFDSEVERKFAEHLDAREDIRLFIKLPGWFTIDTPLGTYNPDWAIVKNGDEKVYFIAETKGSTDERQLREIERDKMRCGRAHFETLEVSYEPVGNLH